MVGENRKPGPVLHDGYPSQSDDHSSRTAVADGLKQPTRESRTDRPQTLPYLALLRMGFTELLTSPPALVSSYLTLSPLPAFAEAITGGLLSVALSLGSPPVPVKDHPALWSPDFPPPTLAQGLSGRRSSGCLQPHQIIRVVNPLPGSGSIKISVRGCDKKQATTVRTGLNLIENKEAVEHLRRQMHMTTKTSSVACLDNSQTGTP